MFIDAAICYWIRETEKSPSPDGKATVAKCGFTTLAGSRHIVKSLFTVELITFSKTPTVNTVSILFLLTQ